MIRSLCVVVLLATSCKSDSKPPTVVPITITSPAKTVVPSKPLLQQCKSLTGLRVRRKRRRPMDEPTVNMPPLATDVSVDGATRRLRSLQAIDELSEQLKADPTNAKIHYALGRVYYYSLETPLAAQRHFCGAVVHDPRNTLYQETVRFVWLSPGLEESMEAALKPSYRRLPWRAVRDSVQTSPGRSDRERARLFMEGLDMLNRIASLQGTRHDRVRWTVNDPKAVLKEWALEDVPDKSAAIWMVTVINSRHRSSVSGIDAKPKDDAMGRTHMISDQKKRFIVFRHGPDAIESILGLLVDRLKGKQVTVYLFQGERKLCLKGRVTESKFYVQRFAAKPDAGVIRRSLDNKLKTGAKAR